MATNTQLSWSYIVGAHLNQDKSSYLRLQAEDELRWFQVYKQVCLKLQIWKPLHVQGASGVKTVASVCIYDEC